MSLLDDAIRQHLDLKRRHGASEDELRELEDEAFGQAVRPGEEEAAPSSGLFDSASEAPTEFLGEAAPGEPAAAPDPPAPGIEDLSIDESSILRSEPEAAEEAEEPDDEPLEPGDAEAELEAPFDADDGDPFEVPPYRVDSEPEEPSAMEHEIAPPEEPAAEPPQPSPHTPAEREEISSHPTQFYDFESDTAPAAPPEAPGAEADITVSETAPEPPPEQETGEEDFFDEQSLSDELDQALDIPSGPAAAPTGEPQVAEPPLEPEPEPEPEAEAEPPGEPAAPPVEAGEAEDLLEETPDFLQDTPENERLWFEQRPPKDFDFDD